MLDIERWSSSKANCRIERKRICWICPENAIINFWLFGVPHYLSKQWLILGASKETLQFTPLEGQKLPHPGYLEKWHKTTLLGITVAYWTYFWMAANTSRLLKSLAWIKIGGKRMVAFGYYPPNILKHNFISQSRAIQKRWPKGCNSKLRMKCGFGSWIDAFIVFRTSWKKVMEVYGQVYRIFISMIIPSNLSKCKRSEKSAFITFGVGFIKHGDIELETEKMNMLLEATAAEC